MGFRGVFVTATDTGAGKTAVTAGIAALLRGRGVDVGVFKPVSSGGTADARLLSEAAGVTDALELVNPVRLEAPLSPNVAAELEGRQIPLEPIDDAYSRLTRLHDIVLVEGVGGLLVPIRDDFLVADLARRLDLPLLVVARAALGTINHTMLTLEAADRRNQEVIGVVYNTTGPGDPRAARTSPEVISRLSGVRFLGIVPYDPGVDVDAGDTGCLPGLIEQHVDLDGVFF
ncbi:MAG: dethiobiotin synthase [Gemmatimonadetes bacterium]|nr:dethiobiotin synthase [Gemmatimonadota bacterium]